MTKKQRRALQNYATLGITLKQLQESLGDAVEINFGPDERRVVFHYDNRKPVARIGMNLIREVMDKHARGEVTTEHLSEWAAMLVANPSYDWSGKDEDDIAEWLNEISLLTLKPKTQ